MTNLQRISWWEIQKELRRHKRYLLGYQPNCGAYFGIDFRHKDLSGRYLRGAILTKALLDRTRLTKCNLSNAILRKASLLRSSLVAANLRGADLCWADLRGIQYDFANFDGAQYSRDTLFPRNFCSRVKDNMKLCKE